MTDKAKPRRLSETVIPGVDYAEKVKIGDILDQDVILLDITKVPGSPEFSMIDEETGEVIMKPYWNVTVENEGKVLTFSTGAVPIDKKFAALQKKLDTGEAELPLLATFSKSGRTYLVE